jgi:hypothetical protein
MAAYPTLNAFNLIVLFALTAFNTERAAALINPITHTTLITEFGEMTMLLFARLTYHALAPPILIYRTAYLTLWAVLLLTIGVITIGVIVDRRRCLYHHHTSSLITHLTIGVIV